MMDPSGSAFYSETYPNPGGFAPDQHSVAQDSASFANIPEQPAAVVSPVYTRYNDAGQDTFAPLPQPSDPSFQPATTQPPPAQPTGFQFQPWMLLALGAAFVLWNRSQE